ncbi:MAG: 5'-nucleotidase, lipoprotein e(P4) family [Candidatus Delongbacteria bacterium]|jgi:5'-nucleotidase (lipoprotein e(P4) family)|nr:5'-nucleotidase, lipoprotein e(P4) family [Candidatus Delongbacteria bacterium]
MKNILLIGCLGVIFLSCQDESPQSGENKKASNEHLVMATAWYQKSAEQVACYYQAFNLATMALEKQMHTDSSEKPNAIVLDIDETLLDNSPFQVKMIQTGKHYSHEFWKQWTDKAEAKALPGAIEFLTYASDVGTDIFYVSNRMENELQPTITNMENLGFPETRPDHFLLKSTTSNKTERRKQITQNYDVLLYVGDNLGDFSSQWDNRGEDLGMNEIAEVKHKFGTEFIILPNPMYGGWVDALKKTSGIDDYQEFIDHFPSELDTWE